MEIILGIGIIGKALWLKKEKAVVIADLHIGYEEALNKQGILVPRIQFKETMNELKELLEKAKPKIIIINGDLKHEFGEISRQEWNETGEILDLLLKQGKVILIKGNHDTILAPIARKKRLKAVDYFILDDICFLHGDKVIENAKIKKCKTLIIGHEHPSISLHEGAKTEKYKCFLLGEWQGKEIVVMPSFLPIIEGSDIMQGELLSPYLKNIQNFEVFIVGDKTYRFGKLKNIE